MAVLAAPPPERSWGTTTIRGFEADLDTSLAEMIPLIETAGSARASLQNERVGLLADQYYAQVGMKSARRGNGACSRVGWSRPPSRGSTTSPSATDSAPRRRPSASRGTSRWFLCRGTRLTRSARSGGHSERERPLEPPTAITGKPGARLGTGLGGHAGFCVSQPRTETVCQRGHWRILLAGQQDLSGNAQVELGNAQGASTQLDVSWRHLGLVSSNGAKRETGFTLRQNGIETRLKGVFLSCSSKKVSWTRMQRHQRQPFPLKRKFLDGSGDSCRGFP